LGVSAFVIELAPFEENPMKLPGKMLMVFLPAFVLAVPLMSSGQQGNQATLVVKVPANATVTIDTVPTRQRGAERRFVSRH